MNKAEFPEGSDDLDDSFEANLSIFDEGEEDTSDDADEVLLPPDTGCELAIRPMLEAQCAVNERFVRSALQNLPDDVLADYTAAASEALSMDVAPTREQFLEAFDEMGWAFVASEGSIIDYVPAIVDEVTELMRSNQGWKFWKSPRPPVDRTNQLVELVDILHFLMSHTLACTHTAIQVESSEDDGAELARIPDSALISRAANTIAIAFAYEKEFLEDPARLSGNLLASKDATITFLNRVTLTECQDDPDIQIDTWRAFWQMVFAYGFTLANLERVYVAKVALNHFRISNGDAAGNYRRVWSDGREDNAHLMDYVMNSDDDLDQVGVLSFLSAAYESN
jgi:cyanate lyase